MRFAYADPPYLGCGKLYKKHHAEALVWDDPEEHRRLVERLQDQYPDGWAMSLTSGTLRTILPMCPPEIRVASWVKPFAALKPNVGVAYAWEPVVFTGGRKVTREEATRRDWVAENITLKKGLTGAKPPRFVNWIISILNAKPEDTLDDLFPGTGVVGVTWEQFQKEPLVEIGGIKKVKEK